jgi:hypothetical protein
MGAALLASVGAGAHASVAAACAAALRRLDGSRISSITYGRAL